MESSRERIARASRRHTWREGSWGRNCFGKGTREFFLFFLKELEHHDDELNVELARIHVKIDLLEQLYVLKDQL